jgi:hypothetical protein
MDATFGFAITGLLLALFATRWIQLVIRCWQLDANEPSDGDRAHDSSPWFIRLRPLFTQSRRHGQVELKPRRSMPTCLDANDEDSTSQTELRYRQR